jgi:chemotaxis protein MotB
MLCVMAGESDQSGMLVYPRMPVPQHRPSEPPDLGRRLPPRRRGSGRSRRPLWIALAIVLVAGLGGAAGYLLAPGDASQLAAANKALAEAQTAARVEKDRADGAQKQLEVIGKDKQALETKLAETSGKVAEAEKQAAAALAAAEQKLQSAVDKSSGTVSTEGEAIHLKLVDKVLFAVGDDQLTDKGKIVLEKVGKALADLPDKQIWVQGHTDDQPIGAAPAKRKGKKAAPATPPRFASNWELSAARALQVVHYLQDVAKIDPARLAALAFGEYRPVSKTNKAQNRRIEIVLYPHKAVIERPGAAAKK